MTSDNRTKAIYIICSVIAVILATLVALVFYSTGDGGTFDTFISIAIVVYVVWFLAWVWNKEFAGRAEHAKRKAEGGQDE